MADDEDQSSKTEDPTEHKLRKLREEGNVPTSREVNSLFVLLGMLVIAGIAGPWSFARILELCAAALQNAGTASLETPAAIGSALTTVALTFLASLIPLLLILMVLGYFGSFLQNGALFSTKPLSPDLNKLNPLEGFKRLFSWKSVVELLKSTLKMLVIGSVMAIVVYQNMDSIVALTNGDEHDLLRVLQKLMLWLLGSAVAIMAVLAAADYLFQRFQYIAKHRMSRRELKDELRDSEGDPHIKARQRQIRRERATKRMMAAVPKADVIVTNPTHYACALRYKPEEGDGAPILVAKGVDAVALRIRELATEHNVPLYEDPPLARQLFKDVEIDQEIPIQLYELVAKVIAFVMALKKKRSA